MQNIDTIKSELNYEKVFKFLEDTFGKCYSNNSFYQRIETWEKLYKGYCEEVHNVTTSNGLGTNVRRSAMLNMAKRVSEDWSAILMADKPVITINGKNKSTSRFIQGSKGSGGVLGSNNFFNQLTECVERAYAFGTSAVVLGIETSDNEDMKYRIDINFYTAKAIIPISYKNGIIKECAFLSKFYKEGKVHYNLSCHVIGEDGYYHIHNFTSTDKFDFTRLNAELEDGLNTESIKPFFFIIKPIKANNIDLDSPMGISVYSEAVDIVLTSDFIYDSMKQDILTGQRIILMDKSLLGIDETGKPIPPQDFKKWCMQFIGDEGAVDIEKVIKEFSPDLHSEELCTALQNNLDLLSMRCGLGSNYYKFDRASGVTATEYIGTQQDLVRNARVNNTALVETMTLLIQQIIWIGANTLGYDIPADAKVTITIPDGIIIDEKAEKEQDRQDVRDGLMSRAEYRAKWYGETPEVAAESVKTIDEEAKESNNNTTDEGGV